MSSRQAVVSDVLQEQPGSSLWISAVEQGQAPYLRFFRAAFGRHGHSAVHAARTHSVVF